MDGTDEKILDLLKGNARMSYQELGDAIGMSRVAAKKRVQKLEKDGIIRGYNTCIYKPGEITAIIDIVTLPGKDPVRVPPKKFAPLLPGTIISFGNVTGKVF